jgi:hypothetical protein
MLLVKGFDIMHREFIAQNSDKGSMPSMICGCVVAFGGSLLLFFLANSLADKAQTIDSLGNF